MTPVADLAARQGSRRRLHGAPPAARAGQQRRRAVRLLRPFGPIDAGPRSNHDVRPHPHIGLATVTYLFEGAMMHRDSTGVVQRIEPGAINWMTAGRGIVHSERTPEDLRARARTQPRPAAVGRRCRRPTRRSAPSFVHAPAAAIPRGAGRRCARARADRRGLRRRLAGAARARRRCTSTSRSPPARVLALPRWRRSARSMSVDRPFAARRRDGCRAHDGGAAPAPSRRASTPPSGARVVLVGGEPLGHRHIWWNFVSSRKQRIVQAADDGPRNASTGAGRDRVHPAAAAAADITRPTRLAVGRAGSGRGVNECRLVPGSLPPRGGLDAVGPGALRTGCSRAPPCRRAASGRHPRRSPRSCRT